MKIKLKVVLITFLLFVIPLISGIDWGYGVVESIENNEWVKFGIVFVVLLAAIYKFLNDRMDNTAISMIISAGLSLILTVPIMKRGILDNFLQESIVDWILIIAVIVGILFIIHWLYKKLNWKGIILGALILALLPVFIDLENILPQEIYYGPVGDFIEIVQGFSNIILIVAVGWIVIMIILRVRGRGRAYSQYNAGTQQPKHYGNLREARRAYGEASRQAELARERQRRAQVEPRGIPGKWKRDAMIQQARDAERQADLARKRQKEIEKERERAEKIYRKWLKKKKKQSL